MRSSAVKKRTIIGASLVCGLTIAAMLGAAVPSAQTQSGQSALRAGSAGVTVRLPRGWRTYPNGVAPRSMPYNDPLVRIVVASTQVRAFPRGCKAETFRFARGGVGLMVVEWLRPQRGVTWTQRPRPFMARALSVRPRPLLSAGQGRPAPLSSPRMDVTSPLTFYSTSTRHSPRQHKRARCWTPCR
jgi:hypothetical protein